jgi:uncharacterized protein (TIGR02421 family)
VSVSDEGGFEDAKASSGEGDLEGSPPHIAPRPWSPDAVDDATLEAVAKAIRAGAPVHLRLPGGGRLYLDRPLPFLVAHRAADDPGTASLVACGASHLVVQDPSFDARPLVHRVLAELAGRLDSVLFVEVWGRPPPAHGHPGSRIVPPACFVIQHAPPAPPQDVLDALEEALCEMRLVRAPEVEVRSGEDCAPPGAPPLVDAAWAADAGAHRLGLEVSAIYRDPETGDVFPRVQRSVSAGVDRAIKEAAAAYARALTPYQPSQWRELGRSLVAESDWEVDRELSDIAGRFDFLMAISPVDADEAWEAFREGDFATDPEFRYRPLAFDPEEAKAELYGIDIGAVSDPTLSVLFREQRAALGAQLSMLEVRNTPRFLYASMGLYGPVEDDLLRLAEGLLEAIHPVGASEDEEDGVREVGEEPGRAGAGRLDCYEFADRARAELDRYRASLPDLPSTVEVRDDISGLMVTRGNLMVAEGLSISERRAEALIQHEVGTHIVTWLNGAAQPLQQLFSGLAGYDELQEGLAVLAEYLVGGLTRARLRLLAARVLAVRRMTEGATFLEVWRELRERARLSERSAFTAAMRVFRSGGLTKDAVYLRGLVRLLRHLEGGGELDPFFIGKITPEHATDIADLQARGVLRPAPLRPRWIEMDGAADRLAAIREGMSVVDLVPRRAW